MKATRIGVLVTSLLLLLLLLAWAGSKYRNSIFRSKSAIRSSLLVETPLGSDVDQVRAFIAKHHYPSLENYGVMFSQDAMGRVIDTSPISAYLGEYRWPFLERLEVEAIWQFDKNNRLVELRVIKVPYERSNFARDWLNW